MLTSHYGERESRVQYRLGFPNDKSVGPFFRRLSRSGRAFAVIFLGARFCYKYCDLHRWLHSSGVFASIAILLGFAPVNGETGKRREEIAQLA